MSNLTHPPGVSTLLIVCAVDRHTGQRAFPQLIVVGYLPVAYGYAGQAVLLKSAFAGWQKAVRRILNEKDIGMRRLEQLDVAELPDQCGGRLIAQCTSD